MLKHLGARYVAALIHMTYQYYRYIKAFSRAQEQICRFTHLHYAARGGGYIAVLHGLNRIHYNKVGLCRGYVFAHGLHVGLAHNGNPFALKPYALRP